MAWNAESKAKMDAAGLEAARELDDDILPQLDDDQMAAVMDVAQWLRKHRGTAGYKRCVKHLFEVFSL